MSWFFPAHPETTDVEFRSLTSVLDYDVVFWHPGETVSEYTIVGEYNGYPKLDSADSAAFEADVARRRKELTSFVQLGRTLVVVLTPPAIAQVWVRRDYSGTGKNARATDIYKKVNALNALPVPVPTVAAEGNAIELVAGEPYAGYYRRLRGTMKYSAYFEDSPAHVLMAISGAGTPLAAEVPLGRGRIVFVPDLAYDPDSTEDTQRVDRLLFEAVSELGTALAGGDEAKMPPWISNYEIGVEGEIRGRLLEVEHQLQELAQKRDAITTELAESENLWRLVTGTGKPLELAVRDAFERLGCKIEDGPSNRTEFVVRLGPKTGVIEVKGVTKSAKEQDAAQLEKWVVEQWEQDGKRPKGILVVNAFREQPLDGRTAAAFPNQMLKFATAREHCLITTTQLLGGLIAAAGDKRAGKDFVSRMFATDGLFPDYGDWTAFVRQQRPASAAQDTAPPSRPTTS